MVVWRRVKREIVKSTFLYFPIRQTHLNINTGELFFVVP